MASRGIASDRDFAKNQLLNARLENRTSNYGSGNAKLGMIYYDTATARITYNVDATGGAEVYATVPRHTAAETISGDWYFNRGGTTAPFRVGSVTKVVDLNADYLDGFDTSQTSTASTVAVRNSDGTLTVANPASGSHAATRDYVDANSTGLVIHFPSRLASTGNVTRSGLQTIDGVAGNSGDLILLKDQTAALENGTYNMLAGTWTRATDANSSAEVKQGMYTTVTEGATNAGRSYVQTAINPVLDTDPLVFTLFYQAVAYAAGNGLGLSGVTFSLSVDGASTWASNRILYTGTNTVVSLVAGSTGQVLRQTATTPAWSTATFPDTATAGGILHASATNVWSGLAIGASGTIVRSTGSLPAYTTTTYPNTATAGDLIHGSATNVISGLAVGAVGQIVRSTGTLPAYTTATYPATTTINQILYSSAANTISGLATANNAVLTTGATGIPVLTALASNGQIIIGSGSGAPIAATITGTSNQITVTNAANSITLSTPQNIHTAATPTFAGLTLNGAETINVGTITASTPATTSSATWNSGAVKFVHQYVNITDTASASTSLFVDYQVASTSKFSIDKTGLITVGTIGAANVTGILALANGGTAAALTAADTAMVYSTASALALTSPNDLSWENTNKRLGIALAGQSTIRSITLGGDANNTNGLQVARRTTSDSAGRDMTIGAGGATVGASDKNGGKLILIPGISTGSAGLFGVVRIDTYTPGTSGTGDTVLSTKFSISGLGNATWTQAVAVTGSPTMATWTGGAHTTLTASTEATDIYFSLARAVQFATGNIPIQRVFRLDTPTYGAVAASVITEAALLYLGPPPAAGTNVTITYPYSILFDDTVQPVIGVRRNTNAGDTRGIHLEIHAGDAPAASNKKGGELQLYGGRSTGTAGGANNGIGGFVCAAGSTGSSLNTVYTRIFTFNEVAMNFFTPLYVNYASTGVAGTAPIKMTVGTLLTAREVGTMEVDANGVLYYTSSLDLSNALDRKPVCRKHAVNLTTGQPGVSGVGTGTVTVDHYLGSGDVTVSIVALTTNNGWAVGDSVDFPWNSTSASRITITSSANIVSGDYRVTIEG